MMLNIKRYLWLLLLTPVASFAQQKEVLSLDEIIQRIDSNNLQLKSYALRAEAYKYSGDAATAWMPPMVGLGTFQTPYPFQEVMDEGDKGMLMLRIEQEIPSRARLQARKNYIQSQGNIENAARYVALNDLKAQARRQYFTWLIALERISIIQRNEKVLETMKKVEEVRYPYNQ